MSRSTTRGVRKPSEASVRMLSVKTPKRALFSMAQAEIKGLKAEAAMHDEQMLDEARRYDRDVGRLTAAIRWALGEAGEFAPPADESRRPDGQPVARYWWRTELRRRSGLTYTPPTTE